VRKPWLRKLPHLGLVVVSLLVAQFFYTRQVFEPEQLYLRTEPSGATISAPGATSVHGFQVKPIAVAPGPLPLHGEERRMYVFVLDLPGYEQKTVRVSSEELKSGTRAYDLEPSVPILIPLLYKVRDYPFLLPAIGLLGWFGFFRIRPQLRLEREQRALWAEDRPQTGLVLHGYKLEKELGEGGAGVVFLARKVDDAGGQEYTVKMLHRSDETSAEQQKEALANEFRACQKLNHPGIVHLYDFGEMGGYLYLVFEYVKGKPLDTVGKASIDEVRAWGGQLVEALRHAHSAGIVHRDIKPANIILTPESRVKVLDFGIAAGIDSMEGTTSGTVGYMSPEQANGVVNPGCDYYSIGVTLYRLLTGRVPFEGDDFFQVLSTQSRGEYKPVTDWRIDVPDELEQLIDALLTVDPEQRLTDPDEVIALLSASYS